MRSSYCHEILLLGEESPGTSRTEMMGKGEAYIRKARIAPGLSYFAEFSRRPGEHETEDTRP